jgi:hypothetical protein
MSAPRLKRVITGALVSGSVAAAGLGLGAGQRLPTPDVNWDMTVCHDWLK